MNSSMIGKIEKAHRYAREPERVQIQAIESTFRGGHDEYHVRFDDGAWNCSCHTFSSHVIGTCSHIMAMQQMLGTMLPANARFWEEEASPLKAGAAVGVAG
ncbi:MAG: hypothetical protein H0V24_11950 [Chloroflexia bacterium]|nr:hypothetical protein [Chloroflexia bacterium]MDQ3412266.1 hypothetical protein [Chloroflexota bacterium]